MLSLILRKKGLISGRNWKKLGLKIIVMHSIIYFSTKTLSIRLKRTKNDTVYHFKRLFSEVGTR